MQPSYADQLLASNSSDEEFDPELGSVPPPPPPVSEMPPAMAASIGLTSLNGRLLFRNSVPANPDGHPDGHPDGNDSEVQDSSKDMERARTNDDVMMKGCSDCLPAELCGNELCGGGANGGAEESEGGAMNIPDRVCVVPVPRTAAAKEGRGGADPPEITPEGREANREKREADHGASLTPAQPFDEPTREGVATSAGLYGAAVASGYHDDDAPVEELEVTTTRTLERIEAAEQKAARKEARRRGLKEGMMCDNRKWMGIVCLMVLVIVAAVLAGVLVGDYKREQSEAQRGSGSAVAVEDNFDGPVRVEDDFPGPSGGSSSSSASAGTGGVVEDDFGGPTRKEPVDGPEGSEGSGGVVDDMEWSEGLENMELVGDGQTPAESNGGEGAAAGEGGTATDPNANADDPNANADPSGTTIDSGNLEQVLSDPVVIPTDENGDKFPIPEGDFSMESLMPEEGEEVKGEENDENIGFGDDAAVVEQEEPINVKGEKGGKDKGGGKDKNNKEGGAGGGGGGGGGGPGKNGG